MSKRKDNHSSIDETSIEVKNYPASLCREHQSQYDDSTFLTLSFCFQNRWASFIIDSCDLEPSMRRNGEELPDRFNIILGDPEDIRNVSLSSEDGVGFVNQPMYNRTIRDAILKSRKDYVRAIAI